MEYVVACAKKIAVFYILASLVKNLVPSEKYGRYIKFFLGMIMIVLVLDIFGEIFDFGSRYEKSFESLEYGASSGEIKECLMMASKEQKDVLASEYAGIVENDVIKYVDGLGASCESCEVNFDLDESSERFGQLSSVRIDAQRGNAYSYRGMNAADLLSISDGTNGEDYLTVMIKNHISEVYNIDRRNIYVNILD